MLSINCYFVRFGHQNHDPGFGVSEREKENIPYWSVLSCLTSLKASIPAAATSLCYHGSITTMQQQGVWVSWNWNQNSGDWSQPQGHQGGYDSYGYANAGYQNQGKGGGYGYDDSYGGSYSCSLQNLFQFTHWIILNILAWHPLALRRSWL